MKKDNLLWWLHHLIPQLGDHVKEVWEETAKEPARDRVAQRYRAVRVFQGEIMGVAGDAIARCQDIIEDETDILLHNYFSDIVDECHCIKEKYNEPNLWESAFELLVRNYGMIPQMEKEYNEPDLVFFDHLEEEMDEKERKLKKLLKEGKIPNEEGKVYHLWTSYSLYSNSVLCFPYNLCLRLAEYAVEKSQKTSPEEQDLRAVTRAACLFIALKNEKTKLKRDAYIYGVKLPDEEDRQPAKPAKGKEPGEETQKVKRSANRTNREILTERAEKYFAKATEMGYMATSGDGYSWLFFGGMTVALVYFLIRVYEPQSPPYSRLEALFGVGNLTQSQNGLVNRDWYRDEMRREKMTENERNSRYNRLKEPPRWFVEMKNFFED